MPVRRRLLLCALSLCLAAPVSAQLAGDLRVHTVWLSGWGNDTVFPLLDADGNIVDVIPNVSRVADFPVPFWYRDDCIGNHWRGGALYTMAFGAKDTDADGLMSCVFTLAKWEDGKWHHLGAIRAGGRGLLTAIPCDGGRFILVSSDRGMFGDEGLDATPFRVVSLPNEGNTLRLGRYIDHGHDGLRRHMSDDDCFSLAFHSRTHIIGNHAVLLNHSTGLYWVFSLESASLVKAGSIFSNVTPRMMAKGGFPHAVLCENVEADGSLLVAAQDEGFFTMENGDAEKELQELLDSDPSISLQAAYAIYEERAAELAERNPFIVWYRIHREGWRVERLKEPPAGGSQFREGGKNDSFRILPDGSVSTGGDGGKDLDDLTKRVLEWMANAGRKVDKKTDATEGPGTGAKHPPPGQDDGATVPNRGDAEMGKETHETYGKAE